MNNTYHCNNCDKYYSCRQNLYAHNKKFHITDFPTFSTILSQKTKKKIDDNLICEYCNKDYSRIDSLIRHQTTCKKRKNHLEQIKELTKENKYLKTQLEKQNNLETQLMKEKQLLENKLMEEIEKQINFENEFVKLQCITEKYIYELEKQINK